MLEVYEILEIKLYDNMLEKDFYKEITLKKYNNLSTNWKNIKKIK